MQFDSAFFMAMSLAMLCIPNVRDICHLDTLGMEGAVTSMHVVHTVMHLKKLDHYTCIDPDRLGSVKMTYGGVVTQTSFC